MYGLAHQNKVEFIFEDEIEAEKEGLLRMKSGSEHRFELLVGSDGQKSKVKELRKIASHGWSHNQKAIVGSGDLQAGLHRQDRASQLRPLAAVRGRQSPGPALDVG